MTLGDNLIGVTHQKKFMKYINGNAYIHSSKESLAQDMLSYLQPTLNRGISDVAALHVGTNDLLGKNGQKNPQWRSQIQFRKWVKNVKI